MAHDKEKNGLKEALVETLKLPKDLCLGSVLLKIVGNREIFIENYRTIIEYSDTCIKIQTKDGKVQITGKRLQILYYQADEMKVSGKIEAINFIVN